MANFSENLNFVKTLALTHNYVLYLIQRKGTTKIKKVGFYK